MADIKQFISIYGTGTRVQTIDGPGVVKAIYQYKVLVLIDKEYRINAKNGHPPDSLPYTESYWSHEEPQHFIGYLYAFDELKLMLRSWNTLRPEELNALDWDNQSIYWAKKSAKGVIKYNEEPPTTFRATEYAFLCALKIDLFDLKEKGIAVDLIEP